MSGPPRRHRHPVRVAHLGLGAFHRSHQAWYTQAANDAGGEWGIAAFTGRSPEAARVLAAQDAVYSLVGRGPAADSFTPIEALSRVHDGADAETWRGTLSDPEVAVLTVTITEAGYRPGSVAPQRILDGLQARFAAGAGALAIVSCDNLPHNGRILRDAVLALADPGTDLAAWVEENVSFVSTMVDRITPATTDADRAAVRRAVGWDDAAPVVAEPFTEWVLAGPFPAGRPAWEEGGARFVADVEPFERRKLWLLNAGHSLLAYHGLLRGLPTVAAAMADPAVRDELERLWAEQRTELPFDSPTVDAALAALRDRFTNARIEHRLAQVAADGSQKLGPRILDPLRSRIAAGRDPGEAQLGVLAAWAVHLTTPERRDPAADALAERLGDARDAAERASLVLAALAPDPSDPIRTAGLADPLARRIALLSSSNRPSSPTSPSSPSTHLASGATA